MKLATTSAPTLWRDNFSVLSSNKFLVRPNQSKPRPPKVCPVCGEDVPCSAVACPECGADHTSGWREDTEAYDGVDLLDEDFNYEEFIKQEFGSSRRPAIKRVWCITAILLIAAFIAIYFYAAH